MKNGKAPDDDNMPIEMFKSGGPELAEWFRRIFNKILEIRKSIRRLETAIVCLILKKKRCKINCGNGRGKD